MLANYILFILGVIGVTVGLPLADESDSSETEDGAHNLMVHSELFGGDMMNEPNNAYDNIWRNGDIPYEIDGSLNSYKNRIQKAFDEYKEKTCIKFRPRTRNDQIYLLLKDGNGCNSYVGRTNRRNGQAINLEVPGCLSHSTIVHELGHAVGFGHTHQRKDRNDYITVHLENVDDDYKSAFNIERSGRMLVAYDTKSVMHYDSYAASKNRKPTIVPKSGGLITDPPGLSASDVQAIKLLYKC